MGRPVLHVGCREPGCDRPHRARGYCSTHYQSHRKAGEFDLRPRLLAHEADLETYLAAYTQERNGCLLWTGSFRGRFSQLRGQPPVPQVANMVHHSANARVFLWELANPGRIVPEGYTVRGTAGSCYWSCVNPDHCAPEPIYPNHGGRAYKTP